MKTTVGRAGPGEARPSAPRNWPKTGAIDPLAGLAARQRLSLLRQQGPDRHAARWCEAAKRFYKEVGVDARQHHPGRRRRRPCLHHRAGRRGLRHLPTRLTSATATTTRPRPSSSWIYGPLADRFGRAARQVHGVRPAALRRARRRVRRRGRGLCPAKLARSSPAAGSISRCMAASSRARRSATPSSRKRASPRSPTPTGSSSCSRRRRRAPINPKGCWDWWGYTGLDYLGKDAPQIKAIWTMVEQLAATP